MSKSLNVENNLIIETIHSVLKNTDSVALHEPEFKGKEWEYVKDCLDTGWVSSVGQYVGRFEEMLVSYTGARFAVAAVNGTAALHLSLILAGVERDDEVLTPALTFVASANAVAYCGAIPHFVDSDNLTLGVDPEKLRDHLKNCLEIKNGESFNKKTKRRVRALVPMHVFGHPVDIDPLLALCEEYHLVLVEDAAESIGSFYKGRHTGNFGLVSCLSFNGNKIVTTGGGGAILTNDEKLAKKAKHLSTTAKVSHAYEFFHDSVGYNYRLPNINAALGCAQLERLSIMIEAKRALAKKYSEAFHSVKSVTFFEEAKFAKSNYWLNALLLKKPNLLERDQLLKDLNDAGLMARPVWQLMNHLPTFVECPRMDLSGAEDLAKRIVNIPSSSKWGENYVKA